MPPKKPRNTNNENLDIHADHWSSIVKVTIILGGLIVMTLIVACTVLLIGSRDIYSIEWKTVILLTGAYFSGVGTVPLFGKIIDKLNSLMKG